MFVVCIAELFPAVLEIICRNIAIIVQKAT